MYAIVEIAGQQFKVQKDQQIFVHRLEGKEGDKVVFNQVLLIDNDGKIAVGAPAIADAAVTGKIIEHQRGDKVIVFKKKRRKGYKTRNGHRQDFTKIQIEAIAEKGAPKASKKAEPKAEKPVVKKTAEPKAEVKKAAPKAAAKTVEKKATAETKTVKSTAAKKPAATAKKATTTKKVAPKKKSEDKK